MSGINNRRDLGSEALSWKVSSAQFEHGIEQLRDDDLSTYWQSNGVTPHRIEIDFDKKQKIDSIAIYTDVTLDESYTPYVVRVLAATSAYETEVVGQVTLAQAKGWVDIPLAPHSKQLLALNKYRKQKQIQFINSLKIGNQKNPTFKRRRSRKPKTPKHLKTRRLIIEVVCSVQFGRDTRIRNVKVWAPLAADTDLALMQPTPIRQATDEPSDSQHKPKAHQTQTETTDANAKQDKKASDDDQLFAIHVPKNIKHEFAKELKRLGLLASYGKENCGNKAEMAIAQKTKASNKTHTKARAKPKNILFLKKTRFGNAHNAIATAKAFDNVLTSCRIR